MSQGLAPPGFQQQGHVTDLLLASSGPTELANSPRFQSLKSLRPGLG